MFLLKHCSLYRIYIWLMSDCFSLGLRFLWNFFQYWVGKVALCYTLSMPVNTFLVELEDRPFSSGRVWFGFSFYNYFHLIFVCCFLCLFVHFCFECVGTVVVHTFIVSFLLRCFNFGINVAWALSPYFSLVKKITCSFSRCSRMRA